MDNKFKNRELSSLASSKGKLSKRKDLNIITIFDTIFLLYSYPKGYLTTCGPFYNEGLLINTISHYQLIM